MPARDLMTPDVRLPAPRGALGSAARRPPVVSRDGRLVGIVVLGDLATKTPDASAEDAPEGLPAPSRSLP